MWHAGLLHKLKSYDVNGQIYDLIKTFLLDLCINVVLDGQSSSQHSINAGVPQGSVLGPTLFLVFINDLPDHVLSKLGICSDDSAVYSSYEGTSSEWYRLEMVADIEDDLRSITEWGDKRLVTFNATKTKLFMLT